MRSQQQLLTHFALDSRNSGKPRFRLRRTQAYGPRNVKMFRRHPLTCGGPDSPPRAWPISPQKSPRPKPPLGHAWLCLGRRTQPYHRLPEEHTHGPRLDQMLRKLTTETDCLYFYSLCLSARADAGALSLLWVCGDSRRAPILKNPGGQTPTRARASKANAGSLRSPRSSYFDIRLCLCVSAAFFAVSAASAAPTPEPSLARPIVMCFAHSSPMMRRSASRTFSSKPGRYWATLGVSLSSIEVCQLQGKE